MAESEWNAAELAELDKRVEARNLHWALEKRARAICPECASDVFVNRHADPPHHIDVFTGIRTGDCQAPLEQLLAGRIRLELSGQDAGELLEREQSTHLAMLQVEIARKAILVQTQGKKGVSGEVTCPKCSGVMKYKTAPCNGHIHAYCKTEGCLVWCE